MKIRKIFLWAAFGLTSAFMLTNCSACDDVLGEWDRPTGAAVTPSTSSEAYSFSLSNLAGDADVMATALKVTDQAGVSIDCTVSDGKYTIKATALGSATDLWFEATTATGNYIAKAKVSELSAISEAGKLKMATLGNIIGADGKFYANKTAVDAASTTGAAMIVYLGNDGETDATYKRGLAIALSDVTGTVTWGTASSNTSLDDKNTLSLAIADMAGIANTATLKDLGPDYAAAKAAVNYETSVAAPAGTSGWFLPSAGQWYKFFNGMCGLTWGTDFGYATTSTPSPTAEDNFNAANKAFGVAGYDSAKFGTGGSYYWSSSEYGDGSAVYMNINSLHGVDVRFVPKDGVNRVRSFLAF